HDKAVGADQLLGEPLECPEPVVLLPEKVEKPVPGSLGVGAALPSVLGLDRARDVLRVDDGPVVPYRELLPDLHRLGVVEVRPPLGGVAYVPNARVALIPGELGRIIV